MAACRPGALLRFGDAPQRMATVLAIGAEASGEPCLLTAGHAFDDLPTGASLELYAPERAAWIPAGRFARRNVIGVVGALDEALELQPTSALDPRLPALGDAVEGPAWFLGGLTQRHDVLLRRPLSEQTTLSRWIEERPDPALLTTAPCDGDETVPGDSGAPLYQDRGGALLLVGMYLGYTRAFAGPPEAFVFLDPRWALRALAVTLPPGGEP